MCSISGFLANKPIDRHLARDIAKALLFYGSERGSQSAGVYVNGQTVKQAVNPADFVDSAAFRNAFAEPTSLALCHTRLPTTGEHGDTQAQPFQANDTVTVHNGYYFDIAGIKETWGLTKRSGVDSELITDFIEGYGINSIGDFLETTDGPSAIAALYKGQLYFAKTGNPLKYITFSFSDGLKILIFASTEEILINACKFIWLIDAKTERKVQGVPEGRLCKVTPTGVKIIGKAFKNANKFNYFDDGFENYGHKAKKSKKKRYKKESYLNYDDFDHSFAESNANLCAIKDPDGADYEDDCPELVELFERNGYYTDAERELYEDFQKAQERDRS